MVDCRNRHDRAGHDRADDFSADGNEYYGYLGNDHLDDQ